MSTTNLENIKRTPTLSCCLHQTQRWSCENIESYFFVVGLIHYFYITRQSREREREKSTTKVTQIFNPPAVHKIKRKETNRWKWWKLLFFLCKLSFNNLWWTELGFLLLCTFWHLCLLVFERIHPSTRARVSCQVFFFLGRLLKAEKKKNKRDETIRNCYGPLKLLTLPCWLTRRRVTLVSFSCASTTTTFLWYPCQRDRPDR